MFIGIYTEPLNSIHFGYKGLQRLNIPAEYWTNKKYGKLYDLSNWYVNNSFECAYFCYTETNCNTLIELYTELIKYCKYADLLLFGADIHKEEWNFLGYDVVGDEYSISMIEELLSDSKDSILSHIIYEYFKSKLNKNYLFDIKKDAAELVSLYKQLKIYGFNIETIINPKPIQIFRYVKDISQLG